MPFVGDIRQDRINYQSGKLHSGEIILEVNSKRVAGMIKKDVIALIKRSADPVSLVSVKQSEWKQHACVWFCMCGCGGPALWYLFASDGLGVAALCC